MAAMFDLMELLGYKALTEAYKQKSVLDVGGNAFFDFYTSKFPAKEVPVDEVQYVHMSQNREPAPFNQRENQARILQVTGKSKRAIALLRAFNQIRLSATALDMISRPDENALQEMGRQEIGDQLEAFGQRHTIQKWVAHAKAFVDGKMYVDEKGRIQETSGASTITVSFGVPASHQGQLDPGSGGIIGTSWASAGAKILDDLDDIREQAEEENVETPTHIWCPTSMKRYLRDNTQLKAYFQGSPDKVDRILSGSMIEDLNGWTWHFFNGTYTASDGTSKKYIPDGRVVITPDPSPTWQMNAIGQERVPRDLQLAKTVEEQISKLEKIAGDFAYVALNHNPIALDLFMGSNYIYAFRNPSSIWQPTVVFQ